VMCLPDICQPLVRQNAGYLSLESGQDSCHRPVRLIVTKHARRYAQSGLSSEQFAAALSAGIGAANKHDPSAVSRAVKKLLRGAGTLTGTYTTNEQLQDQIADDIARRVSSERDFSARLAEGVKADLQSGARNVFTERLSQEERATLQRQAADTLSAAQSFERSESLAERFGTLGSYRAVEIGHGLAASPTLMDRLAERIDTLGLTGDHQRLASSWTYAQIFADPAQARAAAGMALLLGYGEGERTLTAQETQMAREAGFGILAEAFGARGASGVDPNRNATLERQAPVPGRARSAVEAAPLTDPRTSAAGLRAEVGAHRRLTQETYDLTEVERTQARHRQETLGFGSSTAANLRAEKRAHYAELLREQAMLPRPYPRIAAEEMGGVLTKFLQSGALARTGLGGIVQRVAETYQRTGDWRQAIDAGGSGWREARQALIDARLAQVARYGLTDDQMDFFRAATESWLPVGVDNLLGTDAASAREAARDALVAADSENGGRIAELLMRSVISQDDTYLRTIGAYNRANTGSAPASPPLGGSPGMEGTARAVLDLIATPESGGNYNAWYRNTGQDRVDLGALTLDDMRALQADLVQTQGGSAIGRYQLLDDTLADLIGRMGLTGQERFTPALQDRLALQLARDAGMDDWLAGNLSDTHFAQNLAQVWAGLPKDATNQSHYTGIQGNRATADWNTVIASLRTIRGSGS
jgi:conjugal transfer mating pair stabilization protein TraG